MWPTVGSATGIMDRMGTHKSAADSYPAAVGLDDAADRHDRHDRVEDRVTADHTTMVTDPNDVVYVKAQISDSSNRVVTSSSTAVTFSISGPGTIIAVDSGSATQESFRGNARNAYQGLAFAIVQATGAGTITVNASASGLTAASATVQASAGTSFRAPAPAIDVVCLGATPESRRSPCGADRRLPERDRLLRIDVPARQRADAGAGHRLRAGRGRRVQGQLVSARRPHLRSRSVLLATDDARLGRPPGCRLGHRRLDQGQGWGPWRGLVLRVRAREPAARSDVRRHAVCLRAFNAAPNSTRRSRTSRAASRPPLRSRPADGPPLLRFGRLCSRLADGRLCCIYNFKCPCPPMPPATPPRSHATAWRRASGGSNAG